MVGYGSYRKRRQWSEAGRVWRRRPRRWIGPRSCPWRVQRSCAC